MVPLIAIHISVDAFSQHLHSLQVPFFIDHSIFEFSSGRDQEDFECFKMEIIFGKKNRSTCHQLYHLKKGQRAEGASPCFAYVMQSRDETKD